MHELEERRVDLLRPFLLSQVAGTFNRFVGNEPGHRVRY